MRTPESATRPLARARLAWASMAAAAIVIALAVGLLPTPWGGHDAARTALAVARRVQETRTLRIEMQFQRPDGTVAARGSLLSTPERARIEEADGKIGVGEFESGRGIAIDPASRTVIVWQGRLEIPNLYQVFRELRPADGATPGEVQLENRVHWSSQRGFCTWMPPYGSTLKRCCRCGSNIRCRCGWTVRGCPAPRWPPISRGTWRLMSHYSRSIRRRVTKSPASRRSTRHRARRFRAAPRAGGAGRFA